jgi:hypothetical protein
MLQGIKNEITLSIQARNGLSPAVLVWSAVMAFAVLAALVFLCVAGYAWFLLRFDPIIAGLIMAGIFVVVAIIAALVAALIRRQVRERAILARAAKAHSPSWLLDPRLLGVAMEAGRKIGWQRIVPVALLGFVVAQWAREYRGNEQGRDTYEQDRAR